MWVIQTHKYPQPQDSKHKTKSRAISVDYTADKANSQADTLAGKHEDRICKYGTKIQQMTYISHQA